MHRYEDSDDNLTEVFLNVLEEHFPQLQFLNFKLIYDTKRRVSKGRLVLASIETASPKIKYLSKDNIAVDGYDLLLIVDQKAWEVASAKPSPACQRAASATARSARVATFTSITSSS